MVGLVFCAGKKWEILFLEKRFTNLRIVKCVLQLSMSIQAGLDSFIPLDISLITVWLLKHKTFKAFGIKICLIYVFLQFRKFHCSSFLSIFCASYATKIENISDIQVFQRFHRLISSICQPIIFKHFLVFRSWSHSWMPHSLQFVKVFRKKIVKFFRFVLILIERKIGTIIREKITQPCCVFTGLKVAILAKNKPANCQSTVSFLLISWLCINIRVLCLVCTHTPP